MLPFLGAPYRRDGDERSQIGGYGADRMVGRVRRPCGPGERSACFNFAELPSNSEDSPFKSVIQPSKAGSEAGSCAKSSTEKVVSVEERTCLTL